MPPVYLSLAAMSGALLLVAIVRAFGIEGTAFAPVAAATIAVAWVAKAFYWRAIDRAPTRSTVESATGLGHLGKVRLLEMPHTEENFVMREMGYRVARKHARRLRRMVHVLLFAFPLLLMALSATVELPGAVAVIAGLLAVASAAIGVAVERWLFFAEATHTSTLYYGREA